MIRFPVIATIKSDSPRSPIDSVLQAMDDEKLHAAKPNDMNSSMKLNNGTRNIENSTEKRGVENGTRGGDSSDVIERESKRSRLEPLASTAVPTNPATPITGTSVPESTLVTSSDNSHTSGSNASIQDSHYSERSIVPNPSNTASSAAVTVASTTTNMSSTLQRQQLTVSEPASTSMPAPAPAAATAVPPPPSKARTMKHLKIKYLSELEYMLREFRKLERQLLGAKGAAKLEESSGSRERREKLHSFILHLEETVQQIIDGCSLEDGNGHANSSSSASAAVACNSSTTMHDEETVHRLEEHILTNLLPVKIRLKKQLAAQQGATKNPPGMPAPRRGSLQPANVGKGTFAAAAEERRKHAEAARLAAQEKEYALRRVSDPSQFGKPLGGGGSSLTQKLHGTTLGSKERTHGHGVGLASTTTEVPPPQDFASPSPPKILYAGMVPQSNQHKSSLNAASGVHELVVEDPNFISSKPDTGESDIAQLPVAANTSISQDAMIAPQTSRVSGMPQSPVPPNELASAKEHSPSATLDQAEKSKKTADVSETSYEERRRQRKKRRKRKILRIAKRREKERQRQIALQQAQSAQGSTKAIAGRKKTGGVKAVGKKGPKAVEYMCALCSETYASTCEYNPWWALAQHECPKCRKLQIPRVDISAPANAIDYHPALLAHADENGGGSGAVTAPTTNVQVVHVPPSNMSCNAPTVTDQKLVGSLPSDDSDSDLSELSDIGSLSDDSMETEDGSLDFKSMSIADQAEHESFGADYTGPKLSDDDASRLLVLMSHASTCSCRHKLTKHRDVCKSTKFMMLHIRDCPGTTASLDVCPFPWCRKVKHLMYHLVSCPNPKSCRICSPAHVSSSLKNLSGLNNHRIAKHRRKMVVAMKAKKAASSKTEKPCIKASQIKSRPNVERSPTKAKSKPAPVQNIKTTASSPNSVAQPGINGIAKSLPLTKPADHGGNNLAHGTYGPRQAVYEQDPEYVGSISNPLQNQSPAIRNEISIVHPGDPRLMAQSKNESLTRTFTSAPNPQNITVERSSTSNAGATSKSEIRHPSSVKTFPEASTQNIEINETRANDGSTTVNSLEFSQTSTTASVTGVESTRQNLVKTEDPHADSSRSSTIVSRTSSGALKVA